MDDLDRCAPEFIVELVRGMQTILCSPRVVYVLLGDRDWIEQAFAEVNKSMKGIYVGPEHGFGGRFVEKAIQLSMVLPEIGDDIRTDFVRNLLSIKTPEADTNQAEAVIETSEELSRVQDKASQILEITDYAAREVGFQSLLASGELKALGKKGESIKRELSRALIKRSVGDKTTTAGTSHMIEPLAPILPPNPRQIKRIINTLSLLQTVLRSSDPDKGPNSDGWKLFARWVVLMVEWPISWFTLTKHPKLADLVLKIADKKPEEEITSFLNAAQNDLPPKAREIATAITNNNEVMKILTFSPDTWPKADLNGDAITWLPKVMPATSGQMLKADQQQEKQKPDA